jgi:RHS repeat-associated protein
MNLCILMKRVALLVLAVGPGTEAFAARTTTYYHTDALGSVVAASNDAGQVVWRKHYAPFGEQLDATPNKDRIAYTGKQHDDVIGLSNFGGRNFDPEVGRFMSVDLVNSWERNGSFFNRYWYANDNPYRFFDPSGLLVTAVFDNKNLTLTVTDNDTKRTITVEAFSGGRADTDGIKFQNQGKWIPVPKGTYEIVLNPTPKTEAEKRWYMLFKHDGDTNDYFVDEQGRARDGVRLHRGSRSFGCVTVTERQPDSWQKYETIRDIIDHTKTKPIKYTGPNWYSRSNESVSFGTLTVK